MAKTAKLGYALLREPAEADAAGTVPSCPLWWLAMASGTQSCRPTKRWLNGGPRPQLLLLNREHRKSVRHFKGVNHITLGPNDTKRSHHSQGEAISSASVPND